jgi:tetratricopeptide (TPR) repeat protein
LTEQGLEALLAKSVRLHDVVAERFSSSPEGVQKAVALAGMQGAQFLRALVGDAAVALEPDTAGPAAVESALEAAERRHAYIASLDDEQGAFSQRIYQDVAREFLPAFFDEEDATSALRGVVSDVIHGTRILELGRDATMALWRLGVSLFEGSHDVEERRVAVHCLNMLLGVARESGELQVAHRLALRQAALLETVPDARLDGDLLWLRAVNIALADVGDLEAQRPVLTRLMTLTGQSYDEDVNAWTASMYTQTLLDVAEFHELVGDEPARTQVLAVAADVMVSLDGHEEDVGALESSLRLHRMYGEWFVERGELARAVEVQSQAHAIAGRLMELDDGPNRRFDLAVMQRQLGRSAQMREDSATAVASLSKAIDNVRELLETNTSVTLEIQLASTLDDLAETYVGVDRYAEAETLLVEGLQLMRRHLTLAPEASRTRFNLADSLQRLASVRRSLGDFDSAWALSCEAIDLHRAILDQLGTGPAESDLGLALSRAAEVAAGRGSVDDGYGPAREGLELLRVARQRDDTVRALWRLLYAIRVALPFEMAKAGLAAARALLHEADALYAELPPESARSFRFQMSDIERLRAVVLESDGDHLGATKARARAVALLEERVDDDEPPEIN